VTDPPTGGDEPVPGPGPPAPPSSGTGPPPAPDGATERTELAWSRSWLALVVIGLALLRRIGTLGRDRTGVALAVLALAAAAALLGTAYDRHRRDRPEPSRTALLLVSLGTSIIGVVAFVIAATNVR